MDQFQIQIASDDQFATIVHDDDQLTTPETTVSLAAGTYYWRVRQFLDYLDDWSDWGVVREFTVTDGPVTLTFDPTFDNTFA